MVVNATNMDLGMAYYAAMVTQGEKKEIYDQMAKYIILTEVNIAHYYSLHHSLEDLPSSHIGSETKEVLEDILKGGYNGILAQQQDEQRRMRKMIRSHLRRVIDLEE
jgi:hypothetical protein